MKKNLFQKTTLVAASLMVLASCTTYKHSYRISDIPSKDQKVGQTYVYDVQPDLTKKVTAESGKHRSSKNATDDAYYKAIVENNIHIVVDPIYEVRKGGRFLIFGGKYTAKISGFAGFYVNPRTESEYALNKEKQESDILKAQLVVDSLKAKAELDKMKLVAQAENLIEAQKVENFTKFAKNEVLNTVQQQTSIIDRKGESCCKWFGSSKIQLVTTTTTKPSLVEEYNKLISNKSTTKTKKSNKRFRLFCKA
jgi:hypothetical protein